MEAPGWLPDPHGRYEHRYWNGTQWTNQVSTGGRVSIDPATATGSASIPKTSLVVTFDDTTPTLPTNTAAPAPRPAPPPPPVESAVPAYTPVAAPSAMPSTQPPPPPASSYAGSWSGSANDAPLAPANYAMGGQPFAGATPTYASWGRRVVAALINGLSAMLFFAPGFLLLQNDPAIGLALYFAGVIAYLIVYCRAVGNKGQFWGHAAMGIRIVRDVTYQPIGAGTAFGRQFLGFINTIPCYLGWFWPIWDVKHQTFTDKILGTVSIRVD